MWGKIYGREAFGLRCICGGLYEGCMVGWQGRGAVKTAVCESAL